MRKAKIGSIMQTEKVGLFSIIFEGNDMDEFGLFKEKFKNDARYQSDLHKLLSVIGRILENGSQKRYFRLEGKKRDNVVALPPYGNKLRLYCLRMTDSVMIVGNGGVKNTRTTEESEELNGYVITLQRLDELISKGLKDGSIVIEQTKIIMDDDKTFEL